ncbi:MAG: hypothetical protein VR68_15595 [Peptococcaceae bacterium BRH_c4a]|nr:MAG: hypothetical protein VR68_15595 [Peptococcaceae bacterium BRH_c4a]
MKLNGSAAIKMPNLSKREVILVVLFLLSAMIYGYYRFVFEPQWKNIQKFRAELQTQQQALNQRKAQGWGDIGDLRLQTAEIKSKIDKMYLKISNIKDEPTLMVDLYKMTVAHRLMTENIKFSELKEAEGKGYSTFDITLVFMGTNMNIYNFIDTLENYTRLNRISEVIFLPVTPGLILCSLTVEFYVLHEMIPDPPDYPFMVGEMSKNQPYGIFTQIIRLNPDFFKKGGQTPVEVPLFMPPLKATPMELPKNPFIRPSPKEVAPPSNNAPPQLKGQLSPPAAGKEFSGTSAPRAEAQKMLVLTDGIVWYTDSRLQPRGQVIPPERAGR